VIATGTVRSDVPDVGCGSPSCLAPGVEGRPILHGEGPGEVSEICRPSDRNAKGRNRLARSTSEWIRRICLVDDDAPWSNE